MTKAAAMHAFMNGFGLPAYERSSVDRDATTPYLTYNFATAAFGDGEVPIQVDLWYQSESDAVPNAKAMQISATVGMGGVMIPCDGGAIWIKRGSPFCQNMTDPTDPTIKRRYINLTAEFITAD